MNALITSDLPKRSHRATASLADWAGVYVIDAVALRGSAQDAIDSMRKQLATSLVESIDRGFDTTFNVDDMSPEQRADYQTRIDSTLDVVRGARRLYEGHAYERFVGLVKAHAGDLAPQLEQARQDFVSYSREMERVLILFGAGTDEDADTIDLIPDVA